jgi:hypothetical protein
LPSSNWRASQAPAPALKSSATSASQPPPPPARRAPAGFEAEAWW